MACAWSSSRAAHPTPRRWTSPCARARSKSDASTPSGNAARRAAADLAYVQYQQTVLGAFRDVEDALIRIRTEQARNAALHERFSDDEVVNHMIFLMMAAHDTTTTTAAVAAAPEQDAVVAKSIQQCSRLAEALRFTDEVVVHHQGTSPMAHDYERLRDVERGMEELQRLHADTIATLRAQHQTPSATRKPSPSGSNRP